MIEVLDSNGLYVVLIIITLALASLIGLCLFASKEETFEDVVAAQKKEQEALLSSLQGNTKSGKSNKKWNKLKNKKATKKESEEHDADSGVDDEEPSAESVNTPKQEKVQEVIVPTEVAEQEKKPETKSKKKKNKKPVVVEEESVVVNEEVVVESGNSFPEQEILIAEVEEISLNTKPPVVPVEAPVETSQKKTKASKNKDKPVNKPKKKEGSVLGAEKCIADIENMHLNSSDMQQVIDTLLAKQNEQEQWQKPNQKAEPMEQLKRLLNEREDSLAEEQQKTQAIANKNKELRHEVQQERTQRTNIQGQANRFAQQAKEQETIRKRMEDQHLSEKQSMQTQIQRLQELIDGASHDELQKLQEENNNLKKASMRSQQLSEDKLSLVNELNQLQQNNKQLRQELDNTIHQYKQGEDNQKLFQEKIIFFQNEIQTVNHAKSESEAALSQRLQGVNEELLKLEAQNQSLKQDLDKTKQSTVNVKMELETLQKSAPPSASTDSNQEIAALQAKLSESEAKSLSATTSLEELKKHVDAKNAELQKYENDLKGIKEKLKEAEAVVKATPEVVIEATSEVTTQATPTSNNNDELDTLKSQIAERDQQIKELNLKIAATETVEQKPDSSNSADLQKKVDELKAMEASILNLKEKNNVLREKNWKAMDAVGDVEKESAQKIKDLEKNLYKGLKQIHPDVKIPKSTDNDMEKLFNEYNANLKDYNNKECEKREKELKDLQDEIERLTNASKNVPEAKHDDSSSKEELQKAEEEKAQLKSVLAETESMLGRLQAGVDAEVAKWQKQVEDKNAELNQANKKISQLEDEMKDKIVEVIPQSEVQQSSVQDNVSDAKLASLQAQLSDATKQRDQAKDEVADVSTKLKKTISERDLLIREFKTLKDTKVNTVTTSEVDLKSLNIDQLTAAKKLLDEISPKAKKADAKSDKEKDEIITNLYSEIKELKEELQNDSIVVDMGDSDKKVETLEAKLKAAETKIQELEKAQTKQIQSDIEDAMQQLKAKSDTFEKTLEQEKIVNKQLRLQLAAATAGADVGTSV